MHTNEPLQSPEAIISKFDPNFILFEKALSSTIGMYRYPHITTLKFTVFQNRISPRTSGMNNSLRSEL